MTAPDAPSGGATGARRYPYDSPEFARVANLSDAVFAIAMTLLVLTLDVPAVPADQLAAALLAGLPQLLAFAISFLLVANVWWAHHKFVAMLGMIEPGLVAINLVILGAVALVPFPTSLIGNAPTARAAVMPFIAVFLVLLVLFFVLLLRARAVQAWRRPPPPHLYPWLAGTWLANIGAMLLALLVAIWVPLLGLILAAISGTAVGVAMGILAPRAYADWAVP
jgi:uncharacterized membrane protein